MIRIKFKLSMFRCTLIPYIPMNNSLVSIAIDKRLKWTNYSRCNRGLEIRPLCWSTDLAELELLSSSGCNNGVFKLQNT